MKTISKIKEIQPTVFLHQREDKLEQLVRVVVGNVGPSIHAEIVFDLPGQRAKVDLGELPGGESRHELFVPEPCETAKVEVHLTVGGTVMDTTVVNWPNPKHWRVHVVHTSHHDYGYTDLASHVLLEQERHLDQVIDMAEAARDNPYESQFRITVEAAWSIDRFMRNAPTERRERMVDLMRSGHVEITALFGNLVTEICGPETLSRATYHAARLKRQYGIEVISAEHNDVNGISWGLCNVLTDLGVKIFCPGLPLFFSWGHEELPSFWDMEAIFGSDMPGAFWWRAPSGKRLLFWCNNNGCGGDFRVAMPALAPRLQELVEQGYQYDVLRWPVGGGARDNSPYIAGYAETIKQWNRQWAYPQLICSTDAMFYEDFVREIPDDLAELYGELPGTDFPTAAACTAAATGIDRNTHTNLLTAEKLATAASILSDYDYQHEWLFNAYEQTLWYDLHAWGFHFPCGPAADVAKMEKTIHAYRAAALTHDVVNKAMAGIADSVRMEDDSMHLVVFNSQAQKQSGPVQALLREMDNCGSEMKQVPPEKDELGCGYIRHYLLGNRWHVGPEGALLEGYFDLIDLTTGKQVMFEIVEIDSAYTPVPYAGQRLGIGSGSKRLSLFEIPTGLKRTLQFIAEDVPACGYKTYRLAARNDKPRFEGGVMADDTGIENEFYRVKVDHESGRIVSIHDKEAKRELLDSDPSHGFGQFVVRRPDTPNEHMLSELKVDRIKNDAVSAVIELRGTAYGHPKIVETVTLYAGVKALHVAVSVLKDGTPLLNAHVAFPFRLEKPRFRYEGCLSVMNPIMDFLPGCHSDSLAVQNWVKASNDDFSILFSALDAPMVCFGELWSGYVSPAHSCIFNESTVHEPIKPADIKNGWIFSNVFANNFGTNFYATQTGDSLFRYVITTRSGDFSDGESARWGAAAMTGFEQIFTERRKEGVLPVADSFVQIDNPDVMMQTCKRAEDGKGLIVRLWNSTDRNANASVGLKGIKLARVVRTNVAEEDTDQRLRHDGKAFIAELGPYSLLTVRLTEVI